MLRVASSSGFSLSLTYRCLEAGAVCLKNRLELMTHESLWDAIYLNHISRRHSVDRDSGGDDNGVSGLNDP